MPAKTSHRCDVRIGTSGWHYKHWVGTFYPPKTAASAMLSYYSEQFRTVELNNSFYHLPKAPAMKAWRDTTPKATLPRTRSGLRTW